MAKSLDANGAARVYIVGRRKDRLDTVAAKAKNGSIVAIQGDITSKDDLELIAKAVDADMGFVNGAIFQATRSRRLTLSFSCDCKLRDYGSDSGRITKGSSSFIVSTTCLSVGNKHARVQRYLYDQHDGNVLHIPRFHETARCGKHEREVAH